MKRKKGRKIYISRIKVRMKRQFGRKILGLSGRAKRCDDKYEKIIRKRDRKIYLNIDRKIGRTVENKID